MDRSKDFAFCLTEDDFADAVRPLVRYGLFEASTAQADSVNDPARWDKIAIACSEFLRLGVPEICRPTEFKESLKILALKFTAEAAIAWRAAKPPNTNEGGQQDSERRATTSEAPVELVAPLVPVRRSR